MKKRWKQTSAAIMLRNLIGLVIVITLALGFAIVIAVGHQLLEESRINSTQIISSLKQTQVDNDTNWGDWRRASTLDTSAIYVRVNRVQKNAQEMSYYSPNTRSLLAVKPKRIPLTHHVYYRRDKGLFYYATGSVGNKRYDLWQDLNKQVEVLGRVILVTLFILCLTLVISPFYIRHLTKRLTDSLLQLTKSTEEKITAPVEEETVLPVPSGPTEVTSLAKSFNALLTQLHARQEQQKTFVMNAAHELRTPIAAIKSHAQLMERRAVQHPEIVPKSVAYITEESRQMQQLIDELMELSRADQFKFESKFFDLSQLLNEVLCKLRPNFSQNIEAFITPHVQFKGNSLAIERIVENLLTNAAKYSLAGSSIQVILAVNKGNKIALSVTDEGMGISAEDKPHVFERFYRSADVRGTVPGTGLGLAIADRLASLSGGYFSVEDHVPQGTTFTLYLQKSGEGKVGG